MTAGRHLGTRRGEGSDPRRDHGAIANRPSVVIVGAGFAGLDCVRELTRAPADITVVDRNNHHTFQPLLYQVATSALGAPDVAHPVRGILRRFPNVSFRQGEVRGVDWEQRELELEGGRSLSFDYLVIAAGAATSWFGVRGAEEHALPLYGLEDAIHVRNHLLAQFEQAEWEHANGGVAEGRLTFVIVGGGPTGVEMVGALQELFDHVLVKDFPDLDPTARRIVLVEMAHSVLSSFSATAQRHAAAQLRRRGVDLRLRTKVAEVRGEEVTLDSGEHISSRPVVWAPGVRANSLADRLNVEQAQAGRIVVDGDLSIPGRSRAFAAGDIAAIRARNGQLVPQLAPVAKQSGAFVGRRIASTLSGEEWSRLSLPRPGHDGHDRSQRRRGQPPISRPPHRPGGVARLAPTPSAVPHRLPQPAERATRLGLELHDL